MMNRHITEALGNYVVVESYVDNNHVGNMANRRLNYGIIIYVNNKTIILNQGRQNTVESSSSGLDFVLPKIATDMVESL